MTRNVETYSALREIPSQFLTAFCLGCAERGSGIFATLAEQEDAEWFSQALEAAWKAPTGDIDEGELIEILEDFESRTESLEADDPGSRGFSVLQSAMLAVNAIAVHLNPNAARTEMSGQALETVLGSFDFKIGGSQVAITRAGEEEEVGRLQALEQAAQNAFVESVQNLRSAGEDSRLDRQFLVDLRASCASARDEIAAATVSVAELTGWDLE